MAQVGTGVVEVLDGLERDSGAIERERLRAIVDLDRKGEWEGDGFGSLSAWFAARYGISTWKARRVIEAAYALESLPATGAALSSGLLSLDKTIELCRFATPKDEQKLLSWARRVTPAAIRRKADSLQRAEDATEAHINRHLSLYWTGDDSALVIDGLLPQAEGLKVKACIDRLAKQLPDAPDDNSESTPASSMDRKRADALALMASATIAQDQDPDRATVVLYASLEELASDKHACGSDAGPQLHPDVARRLACDCRYQVVATGKDGHIGIGRVAHDVPRWLRRLVVKRDGGCAFPGCEMKTFLHPHHIVHWVLGGPTELGNLVMLCSIHHSLVHEYHWSVILESDKPMFFRPSGRTYQPGVPSDDPSVNELIVHEEQCARARGPSPGSLEALAGVENYWLKEVADDWANNLYDSARSMLEQGALS